MTAENVTAPRNVLQVVFDTAVNSMNFGSGFLDDAEVKALREMAVLLGVDPMDATPHNFQCRYGGKHLSIIEHRKPTGVCCYCGRTM